MTRCCLKVINKAIDSITEEERKSAHEKWIQTGIVDYTKYYLALGVSVFILLLVLIWNYMLNAVVKRKTRQLTQELAERARLEKKLFKAIEKAEESDRLKSAFLANMSHEIRTPMNGIVGFSEMLTDPDLEPELREKYSKIVVDSGEQLLSIVNDILDISRIEAEEVEVNKETFEVNFLLDELCEFFRLKAQRKQIELIAEKESEESPVFIVSDKVKINQILSNLISNAIKFTSKGIIKVSYQLFSDEITFSVKDSGIGISAEMQSKIFDRFRQAELDLTRQYGGTGLGLSISEKLVKLLNGDIWLESTPQKGSTFYFKVPCERSNEKHIKVKTKQENMPSDTERKTKKTVLIAEDEEVNYLYLVEILNHAGIKHILAKNGQEAVNKCSSHPEIDLVLMDIKMPILNGLDATRKIKRLWPKLPIIAITAYALAGDKEKALEAGCDDYLAKPVKKEQLQEMLLRYL
jgi:signal transduction histidine kinase